MSTVADIRPALRTFLLADSGIAAAIVGRIYPGKLPQGEGRASIVYTLISDPGDYTMQGASGLAHPRFQIDAWAPTLDAATSLAILIKGRIDGYQGPMGTGADLVMVQGIFRDAGGREEFDDVAKLWRNGRDYFIWFGER
jgi:hypothetical protein